MSSTSEYSSPSVRARSGSSQCATWPWAASVSMAQPCPPWHEVQPNFWTGCALRGSGGCVRKGCSAASKPFHAMAWWQVTQRSARPRPATQFCWIPAGTVAAFSLPNFSAT